MPQRNEKRRTTSTRFACCLALGCLLLAAPCAAQEAFYGITPQMLAARDSAAPAHGASVHATPHDGDSQADPLPPEWQGVDLRRQTEDEAWAKSWGCVECHQGVHDPHQKRTVRLGCTDCHGGNADTTDKAHAHVHPRFPHGWPTAGNPVRSYTLLNHEHPDFVRFVNPGDLRVAHQSCGTTGCHGEEVLQVRKSMMTHGCMLWGAALYNNGSYPLKWARFGESYSMGGVPQRMQTVPPPTEEEIAKKGVVPFLDPLPRFEVSQPGNILRIFERGGRFVNDLGIPERAEEPGRPRARLSVRGLGTKNRTDPVMIGLTKTRLLDPTLNFLGTNDHPGDYRSSGCTACHMIYANDRSPVHSAHYAQYGNRGTTQSPDPMISKDEPGHPIRHEFTLSIPTSQCIVCHIHPGTNVLNSYLGFMWWDNETDGEFMYPAEQRNPTAEEMVQSQMSNPNEAAARGLWSDPEFLARVSELNPVLRKTQFADFHGHGWVFRAVFKKNHQGTLLDRSGQEIEEVTTEKLMQAMDGAHRGEDGVPVHLMDIHLERGMHCIDCHFKQDSHGNTKLYGEVRAAIEIGCVDCHGTVRTYANLFTSGPAAPDHPPDAYLRAPEEPRRGHDLRVLRTPFGRPRFEVREDGIYQNSMVTRDLQWRIPQTKDTIDESKPEYNELSALAKTVRFDDAGRFLWGDMPGEGHRLAHEEDDMHCIACHSSWNPSCFGCHLPQKANKKMPALHFEGEVSRNYVSYNFQTLRDDVYMLARDGDVTGNRINPARSSCAIHVTSYNQNRENIYTQQQTISAEGMSAIAFSTNVPHTVRGKGKHETKSCTDCHVSWENDNNALLAQLMMHGTNYVNFIGRYCWVANGEHGLHGVIVTEREEPQAVIGSSLHRIAYPDYYREHVERGRILEHSHEHPGRDVSERLLRPFEKPEVLSLQARGEYLYAACGAAGLRVFDIAFIDNKAFAERILTAPVSPLGQQFYVRTRYATSVAAPTTIAPDPTRTQRPENREQSIHPIYGYLFVTDRYEGLILVGAGTLLDGDPTNNFLERELTFNPDGLLRGARSVTIVGTYAYVCCDAGLVVVDLDDPKQPVVRSVVGAPFLHCPQAVQVQFRYAFVCDEQGVKVLDVTELADPVPVTSLELEDAHNIYVARTYGYVAAGHQGLVILDLQNPTRPRIDQIYDAGGCINDLHDVKLGITNVSEFAYLADGKNGLRVVQLTSPETPGNDGFSPRPTPQLIATYKFKHGGHALAISKGIDRDRAVDESGNQIAVFGRVGARPLNFEEQRRLYFHHGEVWRDKGQVWRVSDDPRHPAYHDLFHGRKLPQQLQPADLGTRLRLR